MLCKQLKHKIVSHSRIDISDNLILVDPSCPNSSLIVMKSIVYQYLCSVTLCRDLYMYHSKMTYSMHAHALVKSCENINRSYINLSIRILYSIRKYWGRKICTEGDNFELFNNWFVSWKGLTQSEEDSCNHPVQVLLFFGICDLENLKNNALEKTSIDIVEVTIPELDNSSNAGSAENNSSDVIENNSFDVIENVENNSSDVIENNSFDVIENNSSDVGSVENNSSDVGSAENNSSNDGSVENNSFNVIENNSSDGGSVEDNSSNVKNIKESFLASNIPLINLLNEVLSREMKIKLKGLVSDSSSETEESTEFLSIKLAQKIFDITEENSPKPSEDIILPEPTLISIRESCKNWAVINDSEESMKKLRIDNIIDYINKTLSPYVKTYNFCLGIHDYLKSKNCKDISNKKEKNDKPYTWDDLVNEIETNGGPSEEIIEYIYSFNKSKNLENIFEYLEVPKEKIKEVSETMFLQALICHSSSTRKDITNKNILDSSTLKDLIVDLHMAFYYDLCKIKRVKWLSLIGDITYCDAVNADENVFTGMIGLHTHGLNKEKFWGMVKACKGNSEKKNIFMSKSNKSVDKCFEKALKM